MLGQPLKMPREVIIALTGRCNLACKYCYYADEMVARSDLPRESWLNFFKELSSIGVMHVILSGGEPLTRPDFWDLLDGVVENKMRFGILTNGTLINDQVAESLRNYQKRIDNIQVSIDGSCPETHDVIRGHGSFVRTLRGIDALIKFNLPWSVRVTINKLNVNDLEATLYFLHEKLGLQNIGVNEAYPRGAGHCNHSMLDMSPIERRKSFQVMQSFDKKYPGVVNGMQAGPLVIANLIAKINEARATGDCSFRENTGYLSGCSIMWHKISVLHDGTYVPCHQLPQITLGKIGEQSLKDIWINSPKLLELRKRHTIPLDADPRCVDCQYQTYCTGGCPGIAYAFTNNINTSNPLDCYRAYIGEDLAYEY
jgi:SynChlorMet cassette radical SAM/SPASM protein ScmE